jgi:hypothetical protein
MPDPAKRLGRYAAGGKSDGVLGVPPKLLAAEKLVRDETAAE